MEENNTIFIEERESISYYLGMDTKRIISTIARRYIGENPPHPFVFHGFGKGGFICGSDTRFDLNLEDKLPEAKLQEGAYVAARFWKDEDSSQGFAVSCYGPVRIFANGEPVYRSAVFEEVNIKNTGHFNARCQKGWNYLLIYCVKTSSGFGCKLGVSDAGWAWVSFDSPFYERKGLKGFIYSETIPYTGDKDIRIPDITKGESESRLRWYPDIRWDTARSLQSPLQRIFGNKVNTSAWCLTSFETYGLQETYEIALEAFPLIKLWIDHKPVEVTVDKKSYYIRLQKGTHTLLYKTTCCDTARWYCNLEVKKDGKTLSFKPTYPVQGAPTPWLYLEADANTEQKPEEVSTLYKLFPIDGGNTYWQLDAPDMMVRPYLENDLFGKWNYPLGVTLYGLLQAGEMLKEEKIREYVLAHIRECISMYEYSLWDRSEYGYPEINNQLSGMKTLDDCGSFGSAMLESLDGFCDDTYSTLVKNLADKIAYYMLKIQERQPDGAFYRECKGIFSENTLWADDLYMSIPFLSRYYKMTKDPSYLEDAILQFKLFKKYLWIPEYQIMSHVYDFKYRVPTFMPWGRGNGWVLFSLSELLKVLPEEQEGREEMTIFFNELCEGYKKLQGRNGLWHQLLTHPDSYEETSCTAMFLYGFARGIRYGWIKENRLEYIRAVRKGWEGLTKKSIDKKGNVYGVCGGSAYSYTPEYYKNDLKWRLNDTHGIGIVMLAGIEVMKLQEFLGK